MERIFHQSFPMRSITFECRGHEHEFVELHATNPRETFDQMKLRIMVEPATTICYPEEAGYLGYDGLQRDEAVVVKVGQQRLIQFNQEEAECVS